MLDIRLRHVGVYRGIVAKSQTLDLTFLLFHVHGLVHMSFPGCDLSEPSAFFALIFPGELLTFSYARTRENWVVQFESDDIKPSQTPGDVLLRHADQWVSMPRMAPVETTALPRWQAEFAEIREAFARPTPASRLSAELATANAVRYMVDQQRSTQAVSPAARLKALLDNDTNARRTLEDLSHECGYSADHLRILFKREFQIAPAEYRNRQRLATANDLIATSRFSLKEIAYRTGFRHQSHFSAAYRKAFGISPRDAVKQLRQG